MPPQSSGRTGVLSIQANRILLFRVSGKNLLDHYFVCPAVAKIVFIDKGRLFVSRNVSQAKTPFVKPLLGFAVNSPCYAITNSVQRAQLGALHIEFCDHVRAK